HEGGHRGVGVVVVLAVAGEPFDAAEHCPAGERFLLWPPARERLELLAKRVEVAERRVPVDLPELTSEREGQLIERRLGILGKDRETQIAHRVRRVVSA